MTERPAANRMLVKEMGMDIENPMTDQAESQVHPLAEYKGVFITLAAAGPIFAIFSFYGGLYIPLWLGSMFAVCGLWGLARITGRREFVCVVGLVPLVGTVLGVILFWLEDLLAKLKLPRLLIFAVLAVLCIVLFAYLGVAVWLLISTWPVT